MFYVLFILIFKIYYPLLTFMCFLMYVLHHFSFWLYSLIIFFFYIFVYQHIFHLILHFFSFLIVNHFVINLCWTTYVLYYYYFTSHVFRLLYIIRTLYSIICSYILFWMFVFFLHCKFIFKCYIDKRAKDSRYGKL